MASTKRVSFECDEEAWTRLRVFASMHKIKRTLLLNALLKAFAVCVPGDPIEASVMAQIEKSFYESYLKRIGRIPR
jgi:hypothetical protein